MALIQCRECGHQVSDEADTCPYCGAKMPSKKRKERRLYITVAVLLIAAVILALGYYRVSKAFAPPPVPVAADGTPIPQPKIQKDVPVKQQIIQKDYREKIREMLDSGQNVREISKKTGMRIDEVRKIKKEKAREEKSSN
jgi:hypothetical protein